MACINGRQYIVQPQEILFVIAERELGDGNRWTEIKKPDGTTFTEEEAKRGMATILTKKGHIA